MSTNIAKRETVESHFEQHESSRMSRWIAASCMALGLMAARPAVAATPQYVPPIVTTAPATLYAAGSTSIGAGRVSVDKAGNVFYVVTGGSTATLMEIPAASPAGTNAAPVTLVTALGQYNSGATFVDVKGNLWASIGNAAVVPTGGTGTDYLSMMEIPAAGGIPNTAAIPAGGESLNQVDVTHCSSSGTTAVPCTWLNYIFNTASGAPVSVSGPQMQDLYVDGSGNVYFVDAYDNTSTGKTYLVVECNPFTGSQKATVLASGLPTHSGSQVAVDAAGNAFYLDAGTGVVSQISGGVLTAVGTTATLTTAQIASANGISADAYGNLYIFSSTAISEVPFEGTALNFVDEFGIVSGLSSTTTGVPPVNGGSVDVNGNLFYYAKSPATTPAYSVQELQLNGYNFGSRAVGSLITSSTTSGPAPTMTLYFNAAVSSVASSFPTGSPTSNTYAAFLQSFPYSGTKSYAGGTSFTAGQTGTIVMNFEPVHPGLLKGSYTPRSNGNNSAIINLQGVGVGPQTFFLPGVASSLFSSAYTSTAATSSSNLNGPTGLAVDTFGDIFIADTGNGKVLADCLSSTAVSGNGNSFCAVAGYVGAVVQLGTGFTHPAGIALDGANNLYVTDSSANTVTEIQGVNLASAIVVTATTTFGGTALSGPKGVAVDGYANVYVADTGNNRIVKSHQFGAPAMDNSVYIASTVTFGGTALSSPSGVAVDATGNLFIADTGNNRVVEYTPLGVASVVSTTGITLTAPTAVTVLPSGSLIVTDAANNVSLIAGGTGTALPIGSITPNGPQGVALDPAGNIYLSDTSGGKVVELAVSAPVPVSFASTAQSSTSSSNTTTVRNSGNAALTFVSAPTIDTGDLNFGVLNTGTCASGSSVAPASSCTVLTDFTPQATGALTGTATLTNNQLAYTLVTTTSNETAAFNTTGTQAIALSGTATAAPGATQTIAFAPPVSPVTYGVSPVTLVATATSGLPVTFAVTSGSGTISGNVLTITGGGTIVVAASQSGNTSFAPAPSVSYSILVNTASQTIIFPAVTSPVTYGVSPITLAATSSSGLAVTYSVTSGPGTISGSVLTITSGGTVVVAASQAGNTNYSAATAVSQSITVNTASQTITFPAIASPVTYGVSPITLGATSSSGLAVTYTVTSGPATISGSTLTITGAGTVVVAANQAGNTNYSAATAVSKSVTVNLAPQTIIFTAPATPVLYPGVSPIALVATSSSGLAVTYTVTSGPATISGSTLTITGTGTVIVAASQAGNANYSAAATISYTIVANPPPTFGIAITPGTVTAHHGSFGVVSVAVTPTNGFASAVSFACSGLPAGAICSFSPATVTPSAGPVSSSLTIYAPLTSAALHRNSNARFPGATLALALCFFGLRKRRRLQGLLLLVVSIIGLGMMTGCGSGLSAAPATTSTVTVTATSGVLQSTATVALTVQ